MTDDDGSSESASTTLTINITDDVPTAHPDTGSVEVPRNPGRNVETNDLPAPTAWRSRLGQSTNGSIAGTYGTLTVFADGTYSYVAKPNVPLDTFDYTITDAIPIRPRRR